MPRLTRASLALALAGSLLAAGPAAATQNTKTPPAPRSCTAVIGGVTVTVPDGWTVRVRSRLTGHTTAFVCRDGVWVQVIAMTAPDESTPLVDGLVTAPPSEIAGP